MSESERVRECEREEWVGESVSESESEGVRVRVEL